MSRSFGAPSRYTQASGSIRQLAAQASALGRRALCLVDAALHDRQAPLLEGDARSSGLPLVVRRFGGECCTSEIDAVAALAEHGDCDVLIGFGGGKTVDTVKLAAARRSARTVIVPSIASTDAPCSAIAVRYTEDGAFAETIRLDRNPDLVLVDPEIIVRAPVRFLLAGIGDALSTWFEARSNLESRSNNYVGHGAPAARAGLAIARECHAVLMRDARLAATAAAHGLLTDAVENIIEANILLSGLGFENCGCAAAHGIHNGLTVLEETHDMLHGEKVAFGTLCLLVLENRPDIEIRETIAFCRDLGLPTTLASLGLVRPTRAMIERVAEAALRPGECTFATAATLTVRSITDAILTLDALAGAGASSAT